MEIPRERRVLLVAAFLGACVLALAFTVIAMRSLPLAIGGWLGIIGLIVLFIEPFVGLLNYLELLYIRPQDFVPALAGFPIMLILGAGTALLVVLHRAFQRRSLVIAKVPQHVFVLWFYAAIIASQLALMRVRDAVSASLDFVPTLLMYFLIVELVNTPRRVKIVFHLLTLLTLTLAVQGIFQRFAGAGFGGQTAYGGSRIQGIGIFSDPNDLALVINTVLPLTVLIVLQHRSLLARMYAFVLSCVFVFSIFLTESRGGLLALGLMSILLFQRKFGKIFGVAAGVMVMAALVVLGPRMDTISTEEASSYGRLEAWSLGMDLFKQSPVFGQGYGNFMDFHFRTAHNSFVLCVSELGLFGLFPWLMLFMTSYKNVAFVEKELLAAGKRNFAMYAHAAQLALVVFLVGAMLLSRTYHSLLFVLVALCASITRVYVAGSADRYALLEKKDFLLGFALTIGSVIGFEFFLRVLW